MIPLLLLLLLEIKVEKESHIMYFHLVYSYVRLAYWLVSLLATNSARVRGSPRAKTFHSFIN